MKTRGGVLAVSAVLTLLVTASCPKNNASGRLPATPAPSPALKPTISFSADRTAITAGQPGVLLWSVKNAVSVKIDNGVGSVEPDGRREVYPSGTTTYTLEAAGKSETESAFVKITVMSAPVVSSNPSVVPPNSSTGDVLANQVRDVHFGYGEHQVLLEDQSILESDARILRGLFEKDPALLVLIEGHCDERGSDEYNMGLGDQRANFIKESLVVLGVPGASLHTVSYGKEHPVCLEGSEACFAKNRRAHFSVAP